MNAKEYLEQAIHLSAEIRSMVEELEMLKEVSTASGAIKYDNDRVVGSAPQSAQFENAVVRLVDLENEVRSELNALLEKHSEIRKTIGMVADDQVRTVLRLVYLVGRSMDAVAVQLNVSKRTVMRRLDVGYEAVAVLTGYPAPLKQKMPAKDRHHMAREMLKEVYHER